MKLSRVDACEDWKVVRWRRTQASSHNSEGVVDVWVDEVGMSHCGTKTRVAIHRVVAPAPQPEPTSRLRSMTRDVSFLRSDSRCRRYMSDLFNVTPRNLGSEQKGRALLLYLTLKPFQSHESPKSCRALQSYKSPGEL